MRRTRWELSEPPEPPEPPDPADSRLLAAIIASIILATGSGTLLFYQFREIQGLRREVQELTRLRRQTELQRLDRDSFLKERESKMRQLISAQEKVIQDLRQREMSHEVRYEVLQAEIRKLQARAQSAAGDPLSVDGLAALDHVYQNLRAGSVAFNVPTKMLVGDRVELDVLVAMGNVVRELRGKLQEAAERQGLSTTAEKLKVHSAMRATLSATEGLSVRSIGESSDRFLPARSDQAWRWEVKAVDSGSQRLYLNLSAIVAIEGRELPVLVDTYSREIKVSVSRSRVIREFVGKYAQWIWVTLVAPAAYGFWELFKRWNAERKKRRIITP
ncbi:MAG TPA: hypothetical protein VNJ70_14155 [Thermoanaerobaculia bacterium]|nr:hypothetical protein [Thermoanaerobaculia bacterium]